MKQSQLQPKFVEFIPETLEDGVLYVAMEFRVVAHRCCCGCGSPVYLPLNPTQWRLTFDGEAISMEPSIGSWSLPCRSHYWIRGNRVHWAAQWTHERVEAAREQDRRLRDAHFATGASATDTATAPDEVRGRSQGRWGWLISLFRWK